MPQAGERPKKPKSRQEYDLESFLFGDKVALDDEALLGQELDPARAAPSAVALARAAAPEDDDEEDEAPEFGFEIDTVGQRATAAIASSSAADAPETSQRMCLSLFPVGVTFVALHSQTSHFHSYSFFSESASFMRVCVSLLLFFTTLSCLS